MNETSYGKKPKRIKLYYITCHVDIRREWVFTRNREKGDTYSFDVTPEMFDFMELFFQAPTSAELDNTICIET